MLTSPLGAVQSREPGIGELDAGARQFLLYSDSARGPTEGAAGCHAASARAFISTVLEYDHADEVRLAFDGEPVQIPPHLPKGRTPWPT
jgi:hypothetical protein